MTMLFNSSSAKISLIGFLLQKKNSRQGQILFKVAGPAVRTGLVGNGNEKRLNEMLI